MRISVIIPVKNGAATLKRCLESIRNQTITDIEIIIPDSMSIDDSRKISEEFGADIINVPEGTFDHGLTRNLGVQHASDELVFFTVQDAWLPDADLLERMAKHFEDPEVMAITGHQAVPHEKDKNPIRWYQRYSEHAVEVRQVKVRSDFQNMSQHEQQNLVAWDNVVAMYRRSALVELPFVQTEMAEDWVWSYQALQRGWKLLRDSSLVVYHYHHQSLRYVYRSGFSVNYHFHKFFGYKPALRALVLPCLKAAYHLFRNKELSLRQKFYWTLHNWLAGTSAWLSNFDFLARLRMGGRDGIEKGYRRYCKEIPQGKHYRSPW